jgi:excisionase family DNA binding protein
MKRKPATRQTPERALTQLLTTRELADLLQVPAKTIYTWRYKGQGPPGVVLGRHLRFRPEDVAAWLEAQTGSGLTTSGDRSEMCPTVLAMFLRRDVIACDSYLRRPRIRTEAA